MPDTFTLREYPNPLYINDIAKHPDIWKDHVELLENYCQNYDDVYGCVSVDYVKNTEYGRYFVKDPIMMSCTLMWNRIRATLFNESDYDLDIVCCHQNILATLLKNNTNYNIEKLEHYCAHRNEVIEAVKLNDDTVKKYNKCKKDNKTKKDIVKSLFTIILYGGTIDTWREEYGITLENYELTPFVTEYINEIQMNTNIIIGDVRFKNIVASVKSLKIKEAKEKYKKKFDIEKFKLKNGQVLSVILQEYETLIIEKAMSFVESQKCTVTSYNYDGFQIRKVANVEKVVDALNNHIAEIEFNKFKFENIKFIVKPFKDALDVKVVVLDSINFETQQIIKTKNFGIQKEYFERFHAKIENPFCFIRDDENGTIFIKTKDLTQLYFNIYCKIGKQDEQFIHHWTMAKDIRTFYSYNYYPDASVCPKNCYNLWKPFPILKTPLDPEADTSKIYEFMKMLLRECDDYVLNWLAHIV